MSDQTTSYEVRAELEDLLTRDLLGPWDGPEEELPPKWRPAEQYLLGKLSPRRRSAPTFVEAVDTNDREITNPGDDDADDDQETAQATRTGTMYASAMGLSFRVPVDTDRLVVRASWGRYTSVPSEHHVTEQGNPLTVRKRSPAGGVVELPLTEGEHDSVPDPEQDGVVLRGTVRYDKYGCKVVHLALINDQGEHAPDQGRIYQVSLTMTAMDGHQAIFVGHNDPELGRPPSHERDAEQRHLDLLYRAHRRYAFGRQCAVDADTRDGEIRAWRLTTTCFPAADVPLVEPASATDIPGVVLDMATLGRADLGADGLYRALFPLVTGYRAWLQAQRGRLADPEVARYAPAGDLAVDQAGKVAERLERAIDLLRDNGVAREAFRFANQAMALQRVRGEMARERLSHPERSAASLLPLYDVPGTRSWRPFQLAFILLCLPGLTDPDHDDAHRDTDGAEAQLLFFPTGGGKTEAYLGLTAYTFALRRLQGVVGEGADARDGRDGVAVLMRYTLRLLTAQQFQRAATLVCACEWLRRERIRDGDPRWGETPFRIGLWVGSGVTPNKYSDAKAQLERENGRDEGVGGPLQLVACPWCGQRLSQDDLRVDPDRERILLFCGDPEGRCPFTQRMSPGEGVPVLTVDEDIYRLTPALVIGTVDKFAQLPRQPATATLFGLVDQRCDRHGWMNPAFTGCTGRHLAKGKRPATLPRAASRLRPPDLIIQDELHLISDALGSMVGLYETVIDRLCSRTQSGRVVRPVLVASSATVRRARDQVEQVFARDLTVFPPRVIDADETFFSRVAAPTPDTPSRRYRGILATGERLKAVEIQVAVAVMEHAQYLFERYGAAADPYMTLVDYFSSTRELAGMRRLVEDDVADRLTSDRVRTRRRRPALAELTSRMPSDQIAATLANLELGFEPVPAGTGRSGEASKDKPFDVLLATSMLQVGVDVRRLGLMVVTGRPKNTAEYIQATSRVGRDSARPGLVLMIHHWNRPRDRGHYEDFGYDHATFGMRVEGLTTTPFSDRALDRALSAVVATAVRHSGTPALPNTAAHTVELTGATADALVDLIAGRAEKVTHDNERAELVRLYVRNRLDDWLGKREQQATGWLGYVHKPDVTGLLRKPEEGTWRLWTAPMSLRDVEPPVALQFDRAEPVEIPPWSYDRSRGES